MGRRAVGPRYPMFCDSSLEATLWYTQVGREFIGPNWGGFHAGCEDPR